MPPAPYADPFRTIWLPTMSASPLLRIPPHPVFEPLSRTMFARIVGEERQKMPFV